MAKGRVQYGLGQDGDPDRVRVRAHRERALEEERAENLRLFYVAITRAKHRLRAR